MSKKSARIAALIESCRGRGHDPHYLGFFECFNRGLFYEAHEVLEELWLAERKGPNDAFYKGLIQLAGAFVHLQKNRLRPAAALFKLARSRIQLSPHAHQDLDTSAITAMIEDWLQGLEGGEFKVNPIEKEPLPELRFALPR